MLVVASLTLGVATLCWVWQHYLGAATLLSVECVRHGNTILDVATLCWAWQLCFVHSSAMLGVAVTYRRILIFQREECHASAPWFLKTSIESRLG